MKRNRRAGPSIWYDQGKVVPSLGNCPTIERDQQNPTSFLARPTIQKIQKLHIRILRRLVGNGLDGRGLLIDGIKGGLGEIGSRELVEIEKIGVGELRGELGVCEESQLLIEIEQVLLLALLHRLVVGRWNGIQVLQVLGQVRRTAPVEAGHFDSVTIEFGY